MNIKEIRKAFTKGDYSFTINKVHHSNNSRIVIHDVLSPDEGKEIYDFVIKAIKAYKVSAKEKEEENEEMYSQVFLKGYDKGYSEGYSVGSREAMSDTIKAFAHMNGDYGEGR